MSALLPLPQIIFYLALLFLPQGVLEFSAKVDGHTITWTRAKDWQAQSDTGDAGTWSVKGTSVTASGQTTELREFVSVKDGEAGKKIAQVKGKPVAVSAQAGTLTLSQASGGALDPPVVITYVREGAPK